MKTSIDCEKCGAVFAVKIHSTKLHTITTVCPFCKNEEKLEVGR